MGLKIGGIAGTLGILMLGIHAARADALGDGWPFRRPLTFKQINSDAPGENVATAAFYANGQQKPDGSDIRVTTADRTLVPLRVMQVSGDNDLVRVAFATKGDGPYYVWWGNPKAERPSQELAIHRGIFLELLRSTPAPRMPVATAPAPATTKAAATSSTTKAAAPPTPATSDAGPQVVASLLLPNLGLSYNPLGDQKQVTYHYSASFKIDPAITAPIQLASSGIVTLQIDRKPISTRQSSRVTLAAGWHVLDLQVVNPSTPSVSLSWQRPGDKTMTPFPPALFAQAAIATAGTMERVGGPFVADISADPAAELVITPGTYAQHFIFETTFPDSIKPTIEWSFGDGQTVSDLRKVNHIFLTPGIYPVTLKLLTPGGAAQTTTIRVPITDRLYDRMPKPPADTLPTVRAILKDYNLNRLPAEQSFRGMQYFETAKDDDLQITWGRAWLAGKETLAIPVDDVVSREAFAVARLQLKKKNFKDAAESFKRAAAKPIGMESRVNLIRHEIMTLCDGVNDPAAALKEAQSWATRVVPSSRIQVRTTQIALAYALIATGDGASAKTAIDAALAPPPASAPATRGRAPTTTPANRGTISPPPPPPTALPDPKAPWRTQIEDALVKKNLEGAETLLDQWELADPAALWSGATRLKRVDLLIAQGRPLDAARNAFQHAQANPGGPVAPELLFHAAENYKLAGDQAQASAALDLLLKNYPTSPFTAKIPPK